MLHLQAIVEEVRDWLLLLSPVGEKEYHSDEPFLLLRGLEGELRPLQLCYRSLASPEELQRSW